MRICDSGWELEVDFTATAAYADRELSDNCQCDDCKNFYRTIDREYPGLRNFLLKYGLQLFAPESMTVYRYGGDVECSLLYKVYGDIVQVGTEPMMIDHVYITAELIDASAFYLSLSVNLPWILD